MLASRPSPSAGPTVGTPGRGACTPSCGTSFRPPRTTLTFAVIITGDPEGQTFCPGADSKALESHVERGGYDAGTPDDIATPGHGVDPAFDADFAPFSGSTSSPSLPSTAPLLGSVSPLPAGAISGLRSAAPPGPRPTASSTSQPSTACPGFSPASSVTAAPATCSVESPLHQRRSRTHGPGHPTGRRPLP